ncbi:MAG: hypothetical protein AAGI51_16690, partial [Pseudomonadota bacterium]
MRARESGDSLWENERAKYSEIGGAQGAGARSGAPASGAAFAAFLGLAGQLAAQRGEAGEGLH